ncbi:MAG: hypothetical protein AAFN74_10560, partial [Myxococcota bacterium]
FFDCPVEVHLRDEPILTPTAVEQLTDQALNRPGWVTSTFKRMDVSSLRTGPLLDVVALDDRIAVLGLPPDRQEDPSARCSDGIERPRSLYLVQPNDLSPISTVPFPPCSEHLAADPLGDGFVFVFRRTDERRWWLGRTDINGTVTQQAPLPVFDNRNVQDFEPAIDGSGRLFALVIEGSVQSASYADILSIDLQTFAVTSTTTVSGRYMSVGTTTDGEMLLGNSGDLDFSFIRGPLDRINSGQRVPYRPPGDFRLDLRIVAGAESGRGAVYSVTYNRPAVVGVRGFTVLPAGPLDFDFQPGPIVPWPAYPGRVLVGGITALRSDVDDSGVLYGYDVDTGRLMPGPLVMSRSAVTDIDVGADGIVYALYGWSGELARLVDTSSTAP